MENQILIEEGDTAKFSDEVKIYILSDKPARMSYHEPLGDGFYISPDFY
ncbi:MAG: hypothetical protein R3B93_10215 [Bacteroidia bacterium]